MFLTIKKQTLILIGVLLTIFIACVSLPSIVVFSPKTEFVIVIDAGHGGRDGGSVGINTKVTESELNLRYAFSLKTKCENYGIKVIMTRTDNNGLYTVFSENKKKDDMRAREKIIYESNADLVISLHMNSFANRNYKGAQVFFKKEDESGKFLAKNIQTEMLLKLPNAKKEILVGDYYLLNCTNIPSIIIECGFLSNADEELLLQDENYINLVSQTIFCGIINFLGQ
ncbi:MAG: N-acetylmuramoyl-L-alanine amidase [Clostridia bacterium]